MVSSYISTVTRRWRLILIVICVITLLAHTGYIVSHSLSDGTLAPNESDQNTVSENGHIEISSIYKSPTKKQSVLHGFGGFSSSLPQLQYNFEPEPAEFTRLRETRKEKIRQSFLHGWHGYKKYAFGHDELRPLSNKPSNPFGGWGATMIDSLSTLAIMELTEEFHIVLPRLQKINFRINEEVSVFESIIRYLGGFISAYELSERKEDILLQKAEKLAVALLPAFKTPLGLPRHKWNTQRKTSDESDTLIAEVGTVQLEFLMLSQLTGNALYARKAQRITNTLDKMGYEHGVYIKGLYPTIINTNKGRFKDATTTFGAMGDSVFEYFLKEYLLTEGNIPQYGRMYLESIKGMKQYMLRQVPGYDMILLPPFDTQHLRHRNSMDHLTCFVPGMLSMGAITFNQPEDMEIAKGLLETCVYMYRTTKTGLSPESWSISKTEPYNPLTYNKTAEELTGLRDWWYDANMTNPLLSKKTDASKTEMKHYSVDYKLPPVRERPESLFFGDPRYILRPETIESLFIMYRLTGDQKYQEYGWEIFESIDKWCKTSTAFAAIRNVDRLMDIDDITENQLDSMESFLFAETFKYLYLLFSPSDVISLDKFIFNTEAHPFQRRKWNWDKFLKQ
ncbi:glycoside hydrolase [Pilobolus umbonatus]|nr:glycoside hydrolase [Pilobolus umbonatus]